MKFTEAIQGSVVRESINKDSRTALIGILEGDSVSQNGRFYPMNVVKSVSESVKGRPALIGHDTNSPRDIVARIVDSSMPGRLLTGSFKFGTDTESEIIFSKVREGLIDSVSIRASGESSPGTVNGESVDIVNSLEIHSVDFVVEGGVKAAKVLKVYESAPEIKLKDETNTEDVMTDEQKKQFDEAMAKVKELTDANTKLSEDKAKSDKATEEATAKVQEAELKAHKASKLSTISDTDVRGLIEKTLTGKTVAEVDSQFEAQKALIESLAKKSGKSESDFIVSPADKKNETKKQSFSDVLESADVPSEDKVELIKSLM